MTRRIKLRYLVRERDDRGGAGKTVLSVYREHGVVPKGSRVDNFNKTPQDLSLYKQVDEGDLVVNKMKAWQGSLGVSQHDGAVSGDYLVCRVISTDVDRRYLHQLLRSAPMIDQFRRRSTGIRPSQWRLYWADFSDLEVALPPLAEQRAIADYLDAETARVDALIAKKRHLTHLLEELMKATIRETTRRGLDSEAELVDSGLPWVGRIPAAWELRPNRSFMRLVRTLVGRESELPTLLSLTKKGVVVRDVSENFGKFPESFETYQHVRPGQLVFCLFDMPETPRTVGLARDVGMVTGAYDVFEVIEGDPRFVDLLYRGYDDEKSLSLFYSGLRNVIQKDRFMSIRSPFPPLAEQRRIADALERRTADMSNARVHLERQIDLLAEHRQALVSAAVSGEFAVPGGA